MTTRVYEGNQQASLLVRPAPVASRKLEGEKLGSPAFGCDTRSLGCNRVGGFTSKVLHRFEQCAEPFSHCLRRETDCGGQKRLASAAFEVLDPLPTAFSTCYYSNLWRPV